jgi:hypothetical protein
MIYTSNFEYFMGDERGKNIPAICFYDGKSIGRFEALNWRG